MSTEFTTVPPIPWDNFVAKGITGFELRTQAVPIYVVPCRLIGNAGHYTHAFSRDGSTCFERFGANDPSEILAQVIIDYGVKVVDEFGLDFVDDYDWTNSPELLAKIKERKK